MLLLLTLLLLLFMLLFMLLVLLLVLRVLLVLLLPLLLFMLLLQILRLMVMLILLLLLFMLLLLLLLAILPVSLPAPAIHPPTPMLRAHMTHTRCSVCAQPWHATGTQPLCDLVQTQALIAQEAHIGTHHLEKHAAKRKTARTDIFLFL